MSISQLKLALTRDPRATAIMRPVTKIVSTPEVKKLPKSPSTTENVGKATSKSGTLRTLPSSSSSCFSSSPRQAILKLVPAILKVNSGIVHPSKDSVPQQLSSESHSIKKARSFSWESLPLPSPNSPLPLPAPSQPQPPTSQPSLSTSSPEIPPLSSSQPTLQPPLSISSLVPLISSCQPLSISKPLVASSQSLPPSKAHSQLPISKPLVASSQSLPPSKAPISPSQLPIPKPLVASSQSLPPSKAHSQLPISKPLVASSQSLPPSKAHSQLPISKPLVASSQSLPPSKAPSQLPISKPLVASSQSLPPSKAHSQLPISKPLVASSQSLPPSKAPSQLPISKPLVASSQSLPPSKAPFAPSQLPIPKPIVASYRSLPTSKAPSQLPISKPLVASLKPPSSSQSPPIGSVSIVKSSPLPLNLHPPLTNHNEDKPSMLLSGSGGSAVLSTTVLTPVPSVVNVDEPPQPKKARRQSTALLPVSRVRAIMKAKLQPSKTGQQLGKDSVPTITRAAELFIAVLVQGAEKCEDVRGGNGQVTYRQLATSVNRQSKLQFLHEILPQKVVAKDYLLS